MIIVARYNEDVSWTKNFKNVLIYNKGEPLDDSYKQILTDNVGREGHTYYKHIVDNYDNLDEHIIFLQGNPFDHSPHLINKIKNLNYDEEFTYISEIIFTTNLDEQISRYYDCCKDIKKIYTKLFNIEPKNHQFIFFGAGAQFMVSKNLILKHSKEYYEEIVKMLHYSSNPVEGYSIERLHFHIFMGHDIDPAQCIQIKREYLLRKLMQKIINGTTGVIQK